MKNPVQTKRGTGCSPSPQFQSVGAVCSNSSFNQVLADVSFELCPNRLHGINPCLALLGVEFTHHTAGGDDVGAVGFLGRSHGSICRSGCFINKGNKLVADCRIKSIEPFGGCYQKIGQKLVVGFGRTILHLEEFLGVDVGPGIFLTIDNAGLQVHHKLP